MNCWTLRGLGRTQGGCIVCKHALYIVDNYSFVVRCAGWNTPFTPIFLISISVRKTDSDP